MFLCSPPIHVCKEYFVLPHTYVLGIICSSQNCSPLPLVWRELNKLVDAVYRDLPTIVQATTSLVLFKDWLVIGSCLNKSSSIFPFIYVVGATSSKLY